MKRRRVKIEQIRKAYRAQPFVPFVLRLANGREIPVREREYMLFPPRSPMIAVYDTDDACSIVEAVHVTELEFRRGAKRRRRTA